MIAIIKRAIGPLVIALAATCSPALASSPIGLWYDHTGRGAVEITDCNGKLCGRIVWVKDANHKEGCGFQIIGDVKPVAGGKWDGGWIIDPEKDLKTQVRRGDHPARRQAQGHGLRRRQVPERDHDLDPRPGEPAEMHRIGGARARAGPATGSRSRPQSSRRQRAADRLSAPGGNACAGTAAGRRQSGAAQAGRRARPLRLLSSQRRTARSSSPASPVTIPSAHGRVNALRSLSPISCMGERETPQISNQRSGSNLAAAGSRPA